MSKTTNKRKVKSQQASRNVSSTVDICQKHYFQDSEVDIFQECILKWYDKEQRILPWREIAKSESDPNIRGYSVWVSEVMLQQTQVATVIPYFEKWIKKWPTVKHLATANLEEVLQMWAGLGYYSRGRRLHEGAKIVIDTLEGKIPDSVSELMKLIPGIGAYSASAIASVAFQKVAGVVDGNVIRVLSRMRIIGANISQPGVKDLLWELANEVVSRDRPGDFNQALMELGAVICTPQNPNCAKCPVSSCCSAYSLAKSSSDKKTLQSFINEKTKVKNKQAEIPDIENIADCNFCMPFSVWKENPQVTAFPCKVEKKSPRQEKVNVIVIKNDGKYLIVRRPETGLLAGLWEFPSVILEEESSKGTSLNSMMKTLGLPVSLVSTKKHIGEVIHLFSHIHTTYVVDYIFVADPLKSLKTSKEIKWVTAEELVTEAISTAMKKVHSLLKKHLDNSGNVIKSVKRKLDAHDCNQKSIKSFFKKS